MLETDVRPPEISRALSLMHTEADYYPGEEKMLEQYASWLLFYWRDKRKEFTRLEDYYKRKDPDKWIRERLSMIHSIHTYTYRQMMLHIPEKISYEGARSALMTIVPIHPDQRMPPAIMRDGIIAFGGMPPQNRIVQQAFWETFTQYPRSVEVVSFLKKI